MILLLDNYDSFTYNLYHLLQTVTAESIQVTRNDVIDPDQLSQFSRIVLSPGPGLPEEAGSLNQLIANAANKIPMLGVCLGHQAICAYFGGNLINLTAPYHGVSAKVLVKSRENPLYDKVPETFSAGRYHSWVVGDLPSDCPLQVTATDTAGNIMGVTDHNGFFCGIQFHPESIMSEEVGPQLLENWVNYTQKLI